MNVFASSTACRHNDDSGYRVIRPIEAGEQIIATYVELAATRQERRQSLLEFYKFDVAASPPTVEHTTPEAPAEAQPSESQPSSGTGDVQQSCSQPAAALSSPSSSEAATAERAPQPNIWPPPAATVPLSKRAQHVLHMYGNSDAPPWPTDDLDTQLTQLVHGAGRVMFPMCYLSLQTLVLLDGFVTYGNTYDALCKREAGRNLLTQLA